MARKYRYSWRVRIQEETRPVIGEMAAALGFMVDTPGAKFGEPSPTALLDALAAAYRAEPERLLSCLRPLLEE